jgi:hypothetical protein
MLLGNPGQITLRKKGILAEAKNSKTYRYYAKLR